MNTAQTTLQTTARAAFNAAKPSPINGLVHSTVYDLENAIATGSYYDGKGQLLPLEYIGDNAGLNALIVDLQQQDCTFQRVYTTPARRRVTPKLDQGFTLGTVWASVVGNSVA